MNTMNEFIGPLSESKQSRDELINSGVLDFWISFTSKFEDKEITIPGDVRMAAVCMSLLFYFSIGFISEIWSLYNTQVEDNEENCKVLLQMLKRSNRDKARPLKVGFCMFLYDLVGFFGTVI